MRVSDFIFKFLVEKGVDHVYMLSGGQAMFLVDAVYQNNDIRPICTHHEQAAGMAADAYGRLTGKLGVALVTAGPGSVNVINGVVGGWTDSAPMMIISGQSGYSFVEYQNNHPIRQYGIQGINTRPLLEKVTKYFVTVDDPTKILYYMQKAYHLATTGRPGPVWVDVPLDVQKLEVPEKFLTEYTPELSRNEKEAKLQVANIFQLLLAARRPLFLAGQGLRLANAVDLFKHIAEELGVPVLTSRLGIDIIETDNRLYVGRPGIYGERAANFAIQKSDLIISVGCRLASALVGHDAKSFGKNARIVVVDIDKEELDKPGPNIHLKIQNDVRIILTEMIKQLSMFKRTEYFEPWVRECNHWKMDFPVVLPEYKNEKPVNSYYFTDKLSEYCTAEDMILVDTGTCFHVAAQTWRVKKGQRFLTTGGLSSMGYWVACLGACMANHGKRTVVITGDGSLQMNLQEFATIKYHNFPIKVFIFNNNGYLLIRQTQKNFLEGRLLGEGPDTGVWIPDSLEIAKAYGIKGVRIDSIDNLDEKIEEVMEHDGPVICDVMTPEWQLIMPRVASDKLPDGTLVSRPYEDMFPFLDRELLENEMKIRSGN